MRNLPSDERIQRTGTPPADAVDAYDGFAAPGASIVVVLAATIAVILTVLIASLSSRAEAAIGEADARIGSHQALMVAGGITAPRPPSEADPVTAGRDVAFLVADTIPVASRMLAGTSEPRPAKALAFTIVAVLAFAMTAAATYLWRMFGRSLQQPAPIRTVRRRLRED